MNHCHGHLNTTLRVVPRLSSIRVSSAARFWPPALQVRPDANIDRSQLRKFPLSLGAEFPFFRKTKAVSTTTPTTSEQGREIGIEAASGSLSYPLQRSLQSWRSPR